MSEPAPSRHRSPAGAVAATMVGFGPKAGWMAFLDWSQSDVAALLGLSDVEPASWRHAIAACTSGANRVAVTPPLTARSGDWVLVVGTALLDHPPDVAGWSEVAATEVQYFGTHRVVDAHTWRRAVDGELVRSFVWIGECGELREWVGRPDSAEIECGLPCHGAVDDQTVMAILNAAIGEDTVLSVAGEWSVNPTSLDGRPATGTPLLGSYI